MVWAFFFGKVPQQESRIYYVYAALAKAILQSAKSIYATAVGRVWNDGRAGLGDSTGVTRPKADYQHDLSDFPGRQAGGGGKAAKVPTIQTATIAAEAKWENGNETSGVLIFLLQPHHLIQLPAVVTSIERHAPISRWARRGRHPPKDGGVATETSGYLKASTSPTRELLIYQINEGAEHIDILAIVAR